MIHRFALSLRAPRLAFLAALTLTAVALAPGGSGVSRVLAASSVNLDQWATIDRAWQNGNLNGNNTRYPEGGIVPFRLAIEGLKAGHHTIRIQYDFTAGGHKAYDFLTTWSGWVAPGICAVSGGGISSMCPSLPASDSAAFPSDGFKTDGLTVRESEYYSGVSRRLTIWGGSISSISGPSHAGSTAGNSTAEFLVGFTSTGSAVELAWGGHLAQSAFWNLAAGGVRDGAGEVSGAPWHMRTLQLDGSGNRNQDRSIQPSAIVGELAPRALAPATPTPRPTIQAAAPTPRPTIAPRGATPATPRPTPVARGGTTSTSIPTAPPTSTVLPGDVAGAPRPISWAVLAGAFMLIGGFAIGMVRPRRRSRGRHHH